MFYMVLHNFTVKCKIYMVEKFELEVPYVNTHDNLADFLTKNLAGPPIQSASDAASGYIDAPIVPPRRITYD